MNPFIEVVTFSTAFLDIINLDMSSFCSEDMQTKLVQSIAGREMMIYRWQQLCRERLKQKVYLE